MRNTISNLLFLAAGAAIGSVVTWKLVKTKYERIAQEEIDSVREVYYGKTSTGDSIEDEPDENNEYETLINNAGYKQYVTDKMKEEEVYTEMIEPYVIVPEEFDENGYETVTLFYYKDGVLINAITNEIIENGDELLGADFADHFGENENDEDSVYVRNDNVKIDFEILKVEEKFSEVD